MKFEDRIAAWFESGEVRGRVLKWGWIVSLGFLLVGYVIMFWVLRD